MRTNLALLAVVTAVLLGCLTAATVSRSCAQTPPERFIDVPTTHWAYQAVESLRQMGILIGYPDGNFRGKRTVTRYEAAEAFDRTVREGQARSAHPPMGPAGTRGPQGPRGPQG